MDGKILVENLLIYAQEHLRLGVLDVDFKRACLYALLKISPSEYEKENEKLGKLLSKNEIVNALLSFAKDNGLIENDASCFLDEVFSVLTPSPSIVDRNFKLLREQMDSEKATEYLYDLSNKNNFVSDANYEYLEPKNARKIQIFTSKRKVLSNENLEIDYFKKKNMRAVKFTFDGDDYLMRYLHHHDYVEQGELARENYDILPINADTFDRIFDFLDFIPQYFSTAELCFDENKKASVKRFFIGKDKFPLFEASVVAQLNSSAYPDVEISLTDWILPNVRLSSYNKNTIISLTLDILQGFEKTDIKNEFSPYFTFRLLADGRYCLDIIIAKISHSTKISTCNDDYYRLFDNSYYSTLILGRFILAERATNSFEEAKLFLTKKSELTEEALTLEGSSLYKIGAILKEFIEAQGYFRDIGKAETQLIEKLYDISQKILQNLSPYSTGAEGRLKFKEFLLTVGVV